MSIVKQGLNLIKYSKLSLFFKWS